jgi:hypothetical protein
MAGGGCQASTDTEPGAGSTNKKNTPGQGVSLPTEISGSLLCHWFLNSGNAGGGFA